MGPSTHEQAGHSTHTLASNERDCKLVLAAADLQSGSSRSRARRATGKKRTRPSRRSVARRVLVVGTTKLRDMSTIIARRWTNHRGHSAGTRRTQRISGEKSFVPSVFLLCALRGSCGGRTESPRVGRAPVVCARDRKARRFRESSRSSPSLPGCPSSRHLRRRR